MSSCKNEVPCVNNELSSLKNDKAPPERKIEIVANTSDVSLKIVKETSLIQDEENLSSQLLQSVNKCGFEKIGNAALADKLLSTESDTELHIEAPTELHHELNAEGRVESSTECVHEVSVTGDQNCKIDENLTKMQGSGSKLIFKTKPISEYRGQINTNASPNKGLYILASYETESLSLPIRVLIDCGASVSLLNKGVYAKLPDWAKLPIRKTEKKIKFADGSMQNSQGIVRIPLQVGNETTYIDFLLGEYTDDAILGMADITKLSLNIDFANLLVTQSDKWWFPVHDIQETLIGRKVLVRKATVVPARSQMIVPAYVEDLENDFVFATKPAMLERNDNMITEFGIAPAYSLHQEVDRDISVMVYNSNETDCEIHDDAVLGKFTEVDCLVALGDEFEHGLKEQHKCTDTGNCVECKRIETKLNQNKKQTETEVKNDIELKLKKTGMPEHLIDVYENSCNLLDDEEKVLFKELLVEFKDVFSQSDYDLGRCTVAKHRLIERPGCEPVRIPPRRLTPEARNACDQIVENLLDKGLIRKSNSEWSSPVVMTRKQDGHSWRLCIDYRCVNSRIMGLAHPTPNISETISLLGGNKIFSCVDLASGYWQVELEKESIPFTAFCTRKGLYEWIVLPFGLSNACGSFQAAMEKIVGDMRFNSVLVYIDDVIIFSEDIKSNIEKLRELFVKLRIANMKLKPKKCQFFKREIEFLGYKICEDGLKTCESKVEALKSWKRPENRKEVKSLLGFLGFYRSFIESFSSIAKPLTELTKESNAFVWTEACTQSFDTLRERLVNAQSLSFPKDEGQFTISTDASITGIGGCIKQDQDGVQQTLEFGSRTLSQTEQNWCVTRLELFAVCFFIRRWKHYVAD